MIYFTLFHLIKEIFLLPKGVDETFLHEPFRIVVNTRWMNHVKQNVHNPRREEGQPSSDDDHSDLKLCQLMRVPIYINQFHVISQRGLCGHRQTEMYTNAKLIL